MSEHDNEPGDALESEFDDLDTRILGAANDAEFAPGATGPSQAEQYAELFGQVLTPAFALLAPNWNIQPAEVAALSEAYGALAAKYLPEVGEVGPEISAALVTVAILAPRVRLPRKAKAANDDSGDDDNPATAAA